LISNELGIYEYKNIKRIVIGNLMGDFRIPLTPYQVMILSQRGFSEDYRVRKFIESIEKGEDLQVVVLT